MDLETYKSLYQDDSAPGWDAIDERLSTVYGETKPDWHIAASVKYSIGGEDPLDGISIYKRTDAPQPYLHFVSYGMSGLYRDEDAVGGDHSGWGFEFTFRLALPPEEQSAEQPPAWALNLMQNLARYVYDSKRYFEHGHYFPAGGPLRQDSDTTLTALIFSTDPELGTIDTPHGKLDFLQIVGLTGAEYDAVLDGNLTNLDLLQRLARGNAMLLMDLARRKSVL